MISSLLNKCSFKTVTHVFTSLLPLFTPFLHVAYHVHLCVTPLLPLVTPLKSHLFTCHTTECKTYCSVFDTDYQNPILNKAYVLFTIYLYIYSAFYKDVDHPQTLSFDRDLTIPESFTEN